MDGSTEAGHDGEERGTTRRAWVEVDLGALRRNARLLAARSGVPIVPMIKADAYGLGAVAVARALEPEDPFAFGIATTDEGQTLRDAGIARRVIVFTPLLSEEYPLVRALRLTPTLGSRRAIAGWVESGGGAWHLAIDTGMSRAGIRWDEIGTLTELLAACPPEGAYTHFHSAELDDGTMAQQEVRLRDALARLPARPRYVYAENSPAMERRAPSPWDLARPGVFLYGVGGGGRSDIRPETVAHVRARVVAMRDLRNGDTVSYGATWKAVGDRRVATIAIGYADGYRRSLSNRGVAIVRGRRVPVIGTVTMDMTMLDVTGVPCEVGDVATVLGKAGGLELSVDDVAALAGLSPYELLVGLRLRLPRMHVDGARHTGDAAVDRPGERR